MMDQFEKQLLELGITLNDVQKNQFNIYFELLVEWNSKVNLTAITEEIAVYQKHFYDSLSVVMALDSTKISLLDVGSGAGFPSIPLKIMFPEIKVTIIDALNKRIKFLDALTKALNINVELIHGRAEEFKRKNSFDIVTARAVANLQILSELCIPFAKNGGYFIAMKGPKYKEEVERCQNAFDVLGSEVTKIYDYKILDEERYLIKIKKNKKTNNKYPRQFGKIKKSPL